MGKNKRFTAEQKVEILREIEENGKTVSQVAEEHGIHPNNIFNWRKIHLEMGLQGFKTTRKDITAKARDRRIAELENKLKQKDEVISELAEELLGLKKKSNGLK